MGKAKVTFVRGKFQLQRVSPYPAFAEALRDFFQQIVRQTSMGYNKSKAHKPRNEKTLRQEIQKAVGDELGLLAASIPALAVFLSQTGQFLPVNSYSSGPESLRRFRAVFCKMMASICSPEHPLVLFLDDLQWADAESLQLLSSLLEDTSIQGLAIVGACRDNEVSLDDNLAILLRDLEDRHDLNIFEVALKGLSKGAVHQVNERGMASSPEFRSSENMHLSLMSFVLPNLSVQMVADTFNVDVEQCAAPTKFLYESCRGHSLHTIELMRTLQSNNVIEKQNNGLAFDEDKAREISVKAGKDALQLVKNLIHSLPSKTQEWLSTASLIGADFDAETMTLLCQVTSENCSECALRAGLIIKNQYHDGSKRYRFAHDVVQQASLEIIDAGARTHKHLDIGLRLWEEFTVKDCVEQNAIMIASQLRHCVDLFAEEQTKVDAADLFLKASKQASLASSFQSAASFLQLARSLLPKEPMA